MRARPFVLLVVVGAGGCQWLADVDAKFDPSTSSAGSGGRRSDTGSGASSAGGSLQSDGGSSQSSDGGAGGIGGQACPTKCGSNCVDVLSDAANCGDCGNACSDGVSCDEGVCGRVLSQSTGSDLEQFIKADGSLWSLETDVYYANATGVVPAGGNYLLEATLLDGPVRQVANSGGTTCALMTTGAVYCVGFNQDGEVGNGSTHGTVDCGPGDINTCVPTPYRTIASDAVEVSGAAWYSDGNHFCARKTDNSVYCWGQLRSYYDVIDGVGDHDPSDRKYYSPAKISGVEDARALTSGAGFSCAILGDGTVRCWGGNGTGQLGQGDNLRHAGAVRVPGLTGVTAIAAGVYHVCALAEDGLYCWGRNIVGQVGFFPDGSGGGTSGSGGSDGADTPDCSKPTTICSPVKVPSFAGLDPIVELAGGYLTTCARTRTGNVYCWGGADEGGLANGSTTGGPCPAPDWADCVTMPTQSSITNAVELSLGDSNAFARLADGTVVSWGHGSLGRGDAGSSTAAPVPGPVDGFP